MNVMESQINGELIARSVATRAQALDILRNAHRPSILVTIAPSLGGFTASLVLILSTTPTLTWTGVIVSLVFGIALAMLAMIRFLHKQLSAVVDLVLLNEEKIR